MDLAMANYSKKCDSLGERILKLIPEHPEIMKIENAFDLFKVEGFKCDDLGPSLAQAQGALAWAQNRHEKGNQITE